jgi:membrane protein DedA with SNARE-associated domain
MIDLGAEIARYGVGFVFLNVFATQAGLPLPAVPAMMVAGGLAAEGKLSPWSVLGAAIGAAILADSLWFNLGRWRGRRVLKVVCKVAVSPDSCVQRMESLYQRFGLRSLLFCKFVPGFATVAPSLGGALKAPRWRFQLYDAAGCALWAVSIIGTGALFHSALDKALAVLERMGALALLLTAAAAAAYVVWRFVLRRRFIRDLRMARISVADLTAALAGSTPPLIVDVRTRGAVWLDSRRIPGALRMSFDEVEERLAELPRGRDLILYCT